MSRILIVEDDESVARFLQQALEESGYQVERCGDGRTALEMAAGCFDLILLDVMLPTLDGLEVCRRLRQTRVASPVLLITARDSLEDKIAGLDAGGDDYIVKPFQLSELLARVRALLRRPEQLQATRVTVADLIIDLNSQAVSRDGESIVLTAKEFALLELLARNLDRIVPRTEIVAHVWDDNHDPFTNAVEVYMNRLRGKIDREPWMPLLHTKRGAGYMLSATAPGAA